MEWQDKGYVLASRRHGEADAILTLFTLEHGRHLGLVKGGASRSKRPTTEIGNLVAANWRARLSEQLGHFQIEPVRATAAPFLDDSARLLGLSAACALLNAALPEREPHPDLFAGFARLLEALAAEGADGPTWLRRYVLWEAELLAGLGFGLDLKSCAVTGDTQSLSFVSPRTGRAVAKDAARGYEQRLLALPPFLIAEEAPLREGDVAAGLRLTGHFLRAHVIDQNAGAVGFAPRDRLVELLCRNGA
jgi:DNA repair protein RecO (recombination protein O)